MSFPWRATLTSAGLTGEAVDVAVDWLSWGLIFGFFLSGIGGAWMFMRSRHRAP